MFEPLPRIPKLPEPRPALGPDGQQLKIMGIPVMIVDDMPGGDGDVRLCRMDGSTAFRAIANEYIRPRDEGRYG